MNLPFNAISSIACLNRLRGNFIAFLDFDSPGAVGANGTDMFTTDCPCLQASSTSS